jgi:hypothetical protein
VVPVYKTLLNSVTVQRKEESQKLFFFSMPLSEKKSLFLALI